MTDEYGLTKLGYVRKTFDESYKEITQELIGEIGAINLEAPSVFSVIINTFLAEITRLDEKLEAVYHSQYPISAESVSLDNLCDLNGIKRLKATQSTVVTQVTAENYTVISKSSAVMTQNTKNVFLCDEDVTIKNSECIAVKLKMNEVDETNRITLNQTEYNVAQSEDATIATMLSDLAQKINAVENFTAVVNNDEIVINNDNVFSCYTSENISIVSCTVNANFTAESYGKTTAPAQSLNIINTPIAGWISVTNKKNALLGRDLETDLELRERREESIKIAGAGTLESMKARLRNIADVTSVVIRENTTLEENEDNLPAKSFNVLVLGGKDEDIANMIWLTKPAGIQSFGNTEVKVFDSQAVEQTVYFSRSDNFYVHVQVTLTVSTMFEDAAKSDIQSRILEQILNNGLSNDVIYQSLFKSVYAVDNVISAEIKIAGTDNKDASADSLTFESDNLQLTIEQIATSDLTKILVTVS
jgi:uncharacterized phage protein gp47/JayE